MAQATWYYARDDRQHGPVSVDVLRSLIQSGELERDAFVWRDGMTGWTPAGQVDDLATPTAGKRAPPLPAIVPSDGLTAPHGNADPAGPVAPLIAYQQPVAGMIQFTPRAMEMLRQTAPWARLIAILLFIFSGLMCIGGLFMGASSLLTLGATRSAAGGVPGAILLVISMVFLIGGVLYFIPALYLNRYASGIGRLRAYAREDVLESTLEAQKSFWRFCGIATAVVLGGYALVFVGAMIFAVMFP